MHVCNIVQFTWNAVCSRVQYTWNVVCNIVQYTWNAECNIIHYTWMCVPQVNIHVIQCETQFNIPGMQRVTKVNIPGMQGRSQVAPCRGDGWRPECRRPRSGWTGWPPSWRRRTQYYKKRWRLTQSKIMKPVLWLINCGQNLKNLKSETYHKFGQTFCQPAWNWDHPTWNRDKPTVNRDWVWVWIFFSSRRSRSPAGRSRF